MRTALLPILIALAPACAPAKPRPAQETLEAWDVPLPDAAARKGFLATLDAAARKQGYHLDAATDADVRAISPPGMPITLNAGVWRGRDDAEMMASAIEMVRPGHAWITFLRGEDPARSARFRTALMAEIRHRWPQTARLPVLPAGNIPHPRDLERTATGYRLRPEAAAIYA
ncbi:hypothetical protein HT136_21645 [Novosphingobium profundi]|uniref:hypothetical protein n=1 Tax=Novosphingobium profundi TaxID=1774954 RepID=UPI001BD977F6|nr:hypothetical protein [Novosphingobium profundi]MBT0670979.1 hypothetical protein [Novosphingobium profundi]